MLCVTRHFRFQRRPCALTVSPSGPTDRCRRTRVLVKVVITTIQLRNNDDNPKMLDCTLGLARSSEALEDL